LSPAALGSAFAPNSIEVGVVASTREDAIVRVGQLLEASGRTSGGYTTEMLAVLDELGPYFVIAPGIAIAHGRPSESVLTAGLSLAVLASPLEFGSAHNDPVRLVFGLCATDHDGHIDVLAALAEMLSDENHVNFLLNAPDAGRIHDFLSGGL
jgi:ascorbate PTS system EIIA or EIIAB component